MSDPIHPTHNQSDDNVQQENNRLTRSSPLPQPHQQSQLDLPWERLRAAAKRLFQQGGAPTIEEAFQRVLQLYAESIRARAARPATAPGSGTLLTPDEQQEDNRSYPGEPLSQALQQAQQDLDAGRYYAAIQRLLQLSAVPAPPARPTTALGNTQYQGFAPLQQPAPTLPTRPTPAPGSGVWLHTTRPPIQPNVSRGPVHGIHRAPLPNTQHQIFTSLEQRLSASRQRLAQQAAPNSLPSSTAPQTNIGLNITVTQPQHVAQQTRSSSFPSAMAPPMPNGPNLTVAQPQQFTRLARPRPYSNWMAPQMADSSNDTGARPQHAGARNWDLAGEFNPCTPFADTVPSQPAGNPSAPNRSQETRPTVPQQPANLPPTQPDTAQPRPPDPAPATSNAATFSLPLPTPDDPAARETLDRSLELIFARFLEWASRTELTRQIIASGVPDHEPLTSMVRTFLPFLNRIAETMDACDDLDAMGGYGRAAALLASTSETVQQASIEQFVGEESARADGDQAEAPAPDEWDDSLYD